MTATLHCNEAAEYVSALADGETIPPNAATHIGTCPACQARLRDYLTMGAELRRVASLDLGATIPALPLNPRRSTRSLWKKGLETMRIPKYAFALLILAVVALASSLTVIKVGAHSSGSVLMLNVNAPDGGHFRCPLETSHKPAWPCTIVGSMSHAITGFQFEVLARDGDRVQLGFRSKVAPMAVPGHAGMGPADLKNQPESQYWFQPGEPLKIDVESLGTLEVSGEWMDHMPTMVTESQLDPPADEVRMITPLLLRDSEVVGDWHGGSAVAAYGNQAVMVYFRGIGRFLLSLSPMPGAVEGHAFMNRVSFVIDGKNYTFVAGAPVTRAEKMWVLYEPDSRTSNEQLVDSIGSCNLTQHGPSTARPAASCY